MIFFGERFWNFWAKRGPKLAENDFFKFLKKSVQGAFPNLCMKLQQHKRWKEFLETPKQMQD